MGLKDWLFGKPEQDPILGGLGQTGSSLQPQPAPMQAGDQMIPGAAGGIDAAEIQRRLQASAGDPERMAAELRQMFPGSSISISDSMVQGMFDPQQAAMMGIGVPQGQPAPAQPDPVAQ